jgi:hypothetical protein
MISNWRAEDLIPNDFHLPADDEDEDCNPDDARSHAWFNKDELD